MKEKALALFLALVLIFTCVPLNAFAVNYDATVSVENVSASAGDTVDVNVSIKNNPGIVGATFTVEYHSDLELISAVKGTAFDTLEFTSAGTFVSPCNFTWDSENTEAKDDGIFLKLTFKVSEKARQNDKLYVNITCRDGDVYNNQKDLTIEKINGSVTVLDYIPGDLNDDGIVNTKDTRLIRQYIAGGYNITINEAAADVNDDGVINTKDTRLIRQYIAGGYGVKLLPSTPKCEHNLQAIAAKAATCTEDGNKAYWYCSKCDRYFLDKDGISETTLEAIVIPASHNLIFVSAVAPTTEKDGNIEHWKCSVCNKYFLDSNGTNETTADKIVIEKLAKEESTVIYNVSGSDTYLAGLNVENPNPVKFESSKGLILNDLIAPEGYIFKGWQTASGTPITEIAPGASRQIAVNAAWEKIEYTVQFDSPDVPVESITYTVDKGVPLINPAKQFGYTFVGWSEDGKIVTSIKPGTTGNFVLHANWTSNRNKARAVDKLADPNIIEDVDNGRYLFVYEIGTIENVPLSEDSGEQINSEGITITKELSISKSVQEATADKIAKTVSKATTETSSWTLSDNWNSSTSATSEHDEQKGKTKEVIDSEGNVVSGKYYVSNSKGGSTSVSSSAGGSIANSSKVTQGDSIGINGEYSHKENDGTSVSLNTSATKEDGLNANLGGSYGMNMGSNIGSNIGGGIGVDGVGLNAGLSAGLSSGNNLGLNLGIGGYNKNSATVSVGNTASHDEEDALMISNSRNYNVGTENISSSEGHWDTSSSSSSNWNSTNGYESSKETSCNTTVSNAISEIINDRYSYTSMDSRGGSNSSTRSTGDTESLSDEYASTVEFSTENIESEKKTLQFKSSATGYYRVITAGTVHVFGVVGYDIATNSYYTYTYNVLDNERHAYLDYSKDNSRFNDCENGIIPFEIPYDVYNYISVKIGRSEGLRINEQTGMITSYTGSAEYVVIPEYVSVTDGLNKPKAVKVTGFSKDVFKGNSSIKGVLLPKHVREIPENAFEGCSSLKTVMAMGINKIGSEAFKNCTSLKTFIIDEFVESLGDNAFENTTELYVNAANDSVAQAAFNSGSKKLIVCLSNMKGSIDDRKIIIPSSTKFFGLLSDGVAYRNLSIESNAEETFLSDFSLVENADTPLKLNSDVVTLSRVIVEQSPGFSLILTKPNTDLKLYGNIEFSSKGENAVLTKNVNLSLQNSEVDGTMSVNGNWLINGELTNNQKLSLTYDNGELIHITDEEFDSYLSSSKLTFDANEGSVDISEKTVYYGQTYGDMPTPTRANYTFVGWYTDATAGDLITSDMAVTALADQTLYAHWTPKTFNVTFDANGGTVSTANKTLTFGDNYGTLPTPKKDFHNFIGWFTQSEGGEQIFDSTTPTSASDVTLYAHWTQKEPSGWVKASEMPAGAEVLNRKYSYTLTSYTTSSSSSLSGWTKYDTKSAWGSYGSWSGWSDTKATASDSRQVETRQAVASTNYKTVYHYFRYAVNKTGGYGNTSKTSSYPNYFTYEFDSPLPANGTFNGYNRYQYWYNGTNYISVYACSPYTTKEVVSYNYKTQYRYRDRSKVYTYYYKKAENKESTSYPTGNNISNIQEWVQYRAK